jgi:thiamine-phosphate pyrophosphorylase
MLATGLVESHLLANFPLPPATRAAAARSTEETQFSEPLASLLRRARRLARRDAGREEVGTEHLLAALLALDPASADRLRGLEEQLLAPPMPLVADESLAVSRSGIAPLVDELIPAVPSAMPRDRTAALDHRAETLRILDAAANRGREGLRVVEDYMRFTLSDSVLTGRLKSFRHELTAQLARLGADQFHRSRDTPGDVGTTLRTGHETVRQSPLDVVRANCKRVAESLRTLEEFGKLIDAHAAAALEQLRYQFYSLEQALLTLLQSRERLAGCRLYLLATESLCRHGLRGTIRAALAGGVDAVQLREKGFSDRRLIDLGRQVRDWTRETGALFIMNDRPDIAVLVGADGVHVGQDDLSVRDARRIVGPDRLVGVSTHTIDQARQAVLDGADYLGVGPVFPSPTKQFVELAGLDFVRQVAVEIALPWFAIGGISSSNFTAAAEAGARRIAVSSAVCACHEPTAAARQLQDSLQSAGVG